MQQILKYFLVSFVLYYSEATGQLLTSSIDLNKCNLISYY